MSFIAVICGLQSEKAAVEKSVGERGVRIGVSGANGDRAYELARSFCEEGARAVLSIGVSGGLDKALKPGALVIGERVVAGKGGEWESDIYLLRAAKRAALTHPPSIGAIFGSDIVIDDVETKAVLNRGHECLAVDMESHGAARAAAQAGVPFLAIRAIADPADRALVKAALTAVAPDGSTRNMKTLGEAIRDPKQLPGLWKLGADSGKALATLKKSLPPLVSAIERALG